MPGNLSSEMLAELQRGGPVFFFWEIYFPSGVRRYSDVEIASASLGHMAGKVVEWSVARRSVPFREHALELNPTSVTLEDTDRSISKTLEGSQANAVATSTGALLRLGSPNVAAASWATVYGGILTAWSSPRRHHWRLTFEKNVGPLRGTLLKLSILPSDFPSADQALYAQKVARIWGIHDSRGTTEAGFIPCPLVDKLLFRYLVAQGWVTVDRVHKDGALQTSGFSIVRPTINGRLYTVIDFTSSQEPGVITADVTGYESVGDGSGSLLTGIDCLKHALLNFVYGDSPGGLWITDPAPLHTASFTAAGAWLTSMGWQKASRYYGGSSEVTGLTLIGEFCQTFRLYPTFHRDGRLMVLHDDHRTTDLWHDAPRLVRWDLHDLSGGEGWLLDYDRDALTDRVAVKHVFDSAAGEFRQEFEVRDLSTDLNAPSELLLYWLHSGMS